MLLAWEMGSNLGHLSRLLPLARRFRAHGHRVLVVSRNLSLASRVLGPVGIPFIQAPTVTTGLEACAPLGSFAELLLRHGWGEVSQLWGMVQAWGNIMRLFAANVAVLDYAPTALLAARATGTRCALVGTGFELPPISRPLPPFPELPGSAHAAAASAEERALDNANRVLDSYGAQPLAALCELFHSAERWLTTFPELDHYGARSGERYIGPIGEVAAADRLEWPRGASYRIFAYLRSRTPNVATILSALAACDCSAVCYVPGMQREVRDLLPRERFLVASQPVALQPLLGEADLCVSYAPAGTVASTLLGGIPQLLAPAHAESQLTARRVECLGAGLALHGVQDRASVAALLDRVLTTPQFRSRARAFAELYRVYEAARAADELAEAIELLAHDSTPSMSAH